jgi:hypothetical protein
MKKIFVLFLVLIFSNPNLIAQNKQYQVVVAGFYNVENLFDTIDDPYTYDEDFTPKGMYHYTWDIYQNKLHKLEEVISKIGTDVSPDGLAFWGTAEVENAQVLKDLVNMPLLKPRNYHVVHYNGGDTRGIDCAFVYNPKYFTVTKSLSIPIDLSLAVEEGKPTRDVLYVEGILRGHDTVHIFVGHWPSRRGGETLTAPMRNYVADVIHHTTDSISNVHSNAKILVMGDLNDNPTDASLVKHLMTVDKKELASNKKMYNPWVDFYKKGYGTLAFNDAWGLFDQIILSKAWLNFTQSGFFYKSAHIYKQDFMVQLTGKYKGYPKRTWDGNNYNGGYSDHFPTYILLLKSVN